jgi:chemotaxis signal transduction protein
MLHDALPREASGEAVADSFAVYVDGQSTIIASSHSSYRVGTTLALPDELLNPPAAGCSRLIDLNGQVMAAGARRSSGYREYKGAEDEYRNEVTAVVFVPLGTYRPEAGLGSSGGDVASRRSVIPAGISSREIATFHLAGHWLGLPVGDVIEAIEADGATRLANAPKEVYGALIHRNASLPIYNLHAALGLSLPAGAGGERQIVVVRGENGVDFGILVDTLGEILEVPSADIEDLSNVYVGIASVLASVVKTTPQNGGGMLVLLSVGSMSQQLHGKEMPAALSD